MENTILTGGNASFANFENRMQTEFSKVWGNWQVTQSLSALEEKENLLKVFPVKNKIFTNLEGKNLIRIKNYGQISSR